MLESPIGWHPERLPLPEEKRTNLTRVKYRRAVHISGFEPTATDVLDRRMNSGLRRFAALWGATSTCESPVLSEDGRVITWQVETAGTNWTTRCNYTILRWDELMAHYTGQSWAGRIIHGYMALFEFVWTGTLRQYFKAQVRYGLFFVYPLLALFGFLLLGSVAGFAAAWFGASGWVGMLAGVAVFLLSLRLIGGFFYLDFALADWAFAADLARRDVAGLEDILDRFAKVVVEAIHDPDADEVLLSGVSLGAVMMVEALARGYATTPGLDKAAGRAAFLTVGSSIMKIGLHPAAEGLRSAVQQIGLERSLFWVEYQARVDPINFYGTNPVRDLGTKATGSPLVREIRIRDMMSAEGYRRGQRNSLYLHRQFVMPNAKRYFYDFYHIGFGPLRLAERVPLGRRVPYVFAGNGRLKWKGRRRNLATVRKA
jgi:hypothetical protein